MAGNARLAIMVTALLAACAGENTGEDVGGARAGGPGDGVSFYRSASTSQQGMNIQGMNIQGMNIQGMNIQGMNIQGMNIQGMNIQGTVLTGLMLVAPAGTTASLQACQSPGYGLARGCGWSFAGLGTCSAGTQVTVASAAACGLGSCDGNSMLRVCSDNTPCEHGDDAVLGENDDACDSQCSSVTFTCPESGSYNVLSANYDSSQNAAVTPAASAGSFPLTQMVSGADLIGATLTGVDQNGAQVLFTISDVETDPGDQSGEILLYTVLYYDAGSASWQNACTPDPFGTQKAIPLSGIWDSSGAHQDSAQYFTFGCTSGVAAKCARWGYKPWKSYNGTPLRDFHQTCTRMARADYCGDGTPHTRNGTWIDMYDVLGIQTQVPGDGMLFEAAWLPGGAYCVSKARWNLIGALLLLECPGKVTLPGLFDILNQDSCIMKFTTAPRSSVLMSNRSYIELAL